MQNLSNLLGGLEFSAKDLPTQVMPKIADADHRRESERASFKDNFQKEVKAAHSTRREPSRPVEPRDDGKAAGQKQEVRPAEKQLGKQPCKESAPATTGTPEPEAHTTHPPEANTVADAPPTNAEPHTHEATVDVAPELTAGLVDIQLENTVVASEAEAASFSIASAALVPAEPLAEENSVLAEAESAIPVEPVLQPGAVITAGVAATDNPETATSGARAAVASHIPWSLVSNRGQWQGGPIGSPGGGTNGNVAVSSVLVGAETMSEATLIADAPLFENALVKSESGASTKPSLVAGDAVVTTLLKSDSMLLQESRLPKEPLIEQGISKEAARPTIPAMAGGLSLTEAQSMNHARVQQIPVNISFGKPQWAGMVAERTAMMAAQNIQTAELQLDPPELGPMQVRVQVNNDQVSVSFVSSHANVREALDSTATRLRELMEQQGMNLLDVDVSDQSSRQQEQAEYTTDGRSDNDASEDLQGQEPAEVQLSVPSGIDFYA